MTPLEYAADYISWVEKGRECDEDFLAVCKSHQRIYSLVKKIEMTRQNYLDNGSMIEQSELDKLDEEILAIIAEMEPKK